MAYETLLLEEKDARFTPEGVEDYLYEVEINWATVRGMALKAANSKRGQSVYGPVRVKITGRKRR
jgi:hypothetical protein